MNEIQQVKFNGDLILTTEQLAEFYGTTVNRIIDNFNQNKGKFVKAKHYYLLQGEELKNFKRNIGNSDEPLVNKYSSQLIIWTKRGASRHSKMLGTDQAWDMFDELEENYFNSQQQVHLPTSPRELAKLALSANEETNERIDDVKKDVKDLQDNQTIAPGEYTYISHQVSKAVHEYVRMHDFIHTQQQRAKLYKDISRGLNEVTGVKTRTQLRRKNFDTADEFISNWQPSTATVQIIKQLDGETNGQTSMEV